MPKVYDQQVSWQAANGARMQYDKIQDMITPALENAARDADQVQQSIVAMQDKQVANAADALAKRQSEIIKNFDEFSLKDPQGEMVNRSMKEWDKFIADLPYEARNRFERNNPKAREIFELKSKEAATARARQYTTAEKKANVNKKAQEIIARGVTPEGIKKALQEEYADADKTMFVDDALEYRQLLGSITQQGAIKDAMSHGNLAYAKALNDDPEFTAFLSPEKIANNAESIQRLIDAENGTGSGDGTSGGTKTKRGSLYDNLVISEQNAGRNADTSSAAQRSISVYQAISGGKSIENIKAMGDIPILDEKGNPVLDKNGNPVVLHTIDEDTVIAGGKTLKQIYEKMYPAERQKLMDEATSAVMKGNNPASNAAMGMVTDITMLATEARNADTEAKKQEATDKLDIMIGGLIESGGANMIKSAAPNEYNNVFNNEVVARKARQAQMEQTMQSVSTIYGFGRADLSSQYSRWNREFDEASSVMPLPHTPINEAQAMIDNISMMGQMSKADMIVPHKVDESVANVRMLAIKREGGIAGDILSSVTAMGGERTLAGNGREDSWAIMEAAQMEARGKVPRGFASQYKEDLENLRNGITPMCLTNGVTAQEYADCLAKNGWSSPYSQTMEYDREKRNVTNLAATGRIWGRNGGEEDAGYNEGTYAWALDVVDGLIINEILKNEVYKEESGLGYTTIEMINSSALIARQNLREIGKFDEYIDTSHFSDNGFDPFNPNGKPECAADIKQSALYDFVNNRIRELGGKADSPQAERLAAFMRGAIKDRDIKMKAAYNANKELKTANPKLRGASGVIKVRTNKVTENVLKALNSTEEE